MVVEFCNLVCDDPEHCIKVILVTTGELAGDFRLPDATEPAKRELSQSGARRGHRVS